MSILPALGIALPLGNLYYAYLAWRLAKRENRSDVTAMPYGPSVPHMFIVVFLIIGNSTPVAVGYLFVALVCLGFALLQEESAQVRGGRRIAPADPRGTCLSRRFFRRRCGAFRLCSGAAWCTMAA